MINFDVRELQIVDEGYGDGVTITVRQSGTKLGFEDTCRLRNFLTCIIKNQEGSRDNE